LRQHQKTIHLDNELVWFTISRDSKSHFLHIIMGRKTFEKFSKPLPNRTHIVISRQRKLLENIALLAVYGENNRNMP
jgi:dihydrofolate reductase